LPPSKFSRSRARVVFTREAVITPLNGVPTLMFRLGNERGNQIVNAELRLVLMRTERTAEGGRFYRSYDLKMVRDRALHVIDRESPLYGQTPESLQEQEVEVHVMVLGLDDTTMQSIHADHRYFAPQIRWGCRLVDVLSETDDGDMLLDLRRFHDVQPSEPTPDFPYPRAP
jgi:inward rectifier potassium channel